MSSWRKDVPAALRPKRPRWFLATTAIAAGSVAVFVGADAWRGWSPGDVWGLTFGVLAALLMLLEVLYAMRRRLFIGPLRTGQSWLQAHVYGGTLACLFVLIHTGFRWPHGLFGLILLALTIATTVSGLIGVMAQKTVPVTLASALSVEAIYEKIPGMIADMRGQAEETIKGASDVLQRFYGTHVQPALAGPSVSMAYLLDVRSGRDRQVTDFEGIRSFLSGEDRTRVERLQVLVTRKRELEAHYTWQTMLRRWPYLHVPVALLLIAAVVAHLAAVWQY